MWETKSKSKDKISNFISTGILLCNISIALRGFLSLRKRYKLLKLDYPITLIKGTIANLPTVDYELFKLNQTFQKVKVYHTVSHYDPPFYYQGGNIGIPIGGETTRVKEKLGSFKILHPNVLHLDAKVSERSETVHPNSLNNYNLIFVLSDEYKYKKTRMSYDKCLAICENNYNVELESSNSKQVELLEGATLPVLCFTSKNDLYISDDKETLIETISFLQTPYARTILICGLISTGLTLFGIWITNTDLENKKKYRK